MQSQTVLQKSFSSFQISARDHFHKIALVSTVTTVIDICYLDSLLHLFCSAKMWHEAESQQNKSFVFSSIIRNYFNLCFEAVLQPGHLLPSSGNGSLFKKQFQTATKSSDRI